MGCVSDGGVGCRVWVLGGWVSGCAVACCVLGYSVSGLVLGG